MTLLAGIVILVHGWLGAGSEWDTMQTALVAQGYTVYAPTLPGQENIQNAVFLQGFIDQVAPGQKVTIVAHSMGALSARWYIKNLGGSGRVDRLITIGGANQGSWLTCGLPDWYGGEMCPVSPFMALLNSGPQAIPPVVYDAFWGYHDALSWLSGAACNQSFGQVAHFDEPTSPIVLRFVQKALTGVCP